MLPNKLRRESLNGFFLPVLAVAGLLLFWEISAHTGWYNPVLFPPPSRISAALLGMAESGQLLADIKQSMQRYLVGWLVGVVMGVGLGFLTGRIPLLSKTVGPVLNYMRSTPSVALIPLAIVWFGISDAQKIFIVAWGVTFPVWLNTHAGMAEVEREYVWAAQSFGADTLHIFTEVLLPRTIPFLVAGARIGIATGFFGLAAAEMAGAFGGVAFRIFHSHQMFQADRMMAAIMTIGALAICCDRIFVWSAKKILPWWAGEYAPGDGNN